MRTTTTPCNACADHDHADCPGSVPECPAFLDSLDMDACAALFDFPVSTRETPDTGHHCYPYAPLAAAHARYDMRAAGITA